MAIAPTAPLVYRIVSKANYRGGVAPAKLAEIVAAMNADTTGQYQLVYAGGNTIIYDWAPIMTSNASATIALRKVIDWSGVTFSAVSTMIVKGI